MPDTNICAKCKSQGTPIKVGILRKTKELGPYEWKCSSCGFEWDINEDFNCMECGKEVPGRYLFCSTECEEKSEW